MQLKYQKQKPSLGRIRPVSVFYSLYHLIIVTDTFVFKQHFSVVAGLVELILHSLGTVGEFNL